MCWEKPLSKEDIRLLLRTNSENGPCEVVDGPIGPMVICDATGKGYSIFYCGGDGTAWLTAAEFKHQYPQWPFVMSDPEFDLDDMELAEIIMEELK